MNCGDTLVGALVQSVLLESPVAVLSDHKRVGVLVRRALARYGLQVAEIASDDDASTVVMPMLPAPEPDSDATQVLALLEVQS